MSSDLAVRASSPPAPSCHIEKENSVVYTFAERQLNSDLLNRVDDETKTFETEAESEKNAYLEWLDKVKSQVLN